MTKPFPSSSARRGDHRPSVPAQRAPAIAMCESQGCHCRPPREASSLAQMTMSPAAGILRIMLAAHAACGADRLD